MKKKKKKKLMKKKKRKFFSSYVLIPPTVPLRTSATPISKEEHFEARSYQTRKVNHL